MKCNIKDYIELYKHTKINKFKNISSSTYQFHSIKYTMYIYIYIVICYMCIHVHMYSKNNDSDYRIMVFSWQF